MKTILFVFSLLILATSCGTPDRDSSTDTTQTLEEFGEELSADMQREWQDIESSLETYQMKIDEKIKDLDAQMAEANEETKAKLEREKEEFQAWSSKMKAKMSMTQDEVAKDWKNFKRETKEYFEEVQKVLSGDS